MPTIIDSLFLELGIDTSKFSADQQKALAKIAEFEKKSKRGASKAAGAVKTVGEAFRDIADDSAIGTSTKRLDSFAVKLKALGQASQVSGGIGTPLGSMVEGLGALLSPAALGVAALALVGKGVWDLNEKMTGLNATTFRQSQLAGMNAKALWAWGETARTVGAQPQDITGGIAALQTAVTGMGIGAGDATAQLVAASRLGVGWNFKSGVDIGQLFERVHQLAAQRGYRNLGSLRALTGPLMNDAMFNVATNRTYDPAKLESYIKRAAPVALGAVLEKSLKSQTILGKLGIRKDILAETAYGGIQGPMTALVTLMTNLLALTNSLLGWTIKIADYIDSGVVGWLAKLVEFFTGSPTGKTSMPPLIGGEKVSGKLPDAFEDRQALAMRVLMGRGMSQSDAAAMIGNASQESALNPTATTDNGAHIGLFQLDKKRQADFARKFGYQIGAKNVPDRQQFLQELMFQQLEFWTTQKDAARRMAAASDLYGKTKAFQDYDERPGAWDHSFGRRLLYAEKAFELGAAYAGMLSAANGRRPVAHHSKVTHHTQIGEVNVHTKATDAKGMAAGARHALSAHPLIAPTAQHQVTLATSAVAG